MFEAVGLYLLAINAAAFAAFAIDKQRALDGHRRIPERTLLLLAALGGTPGAFAARALLRHKTRKQPFSAQLMLIAVSQVAIGVAVAVWARPGG